MEGVNQKSGSKTKSKVASVGASQWRYNQRYVLSLKEGKGDEVNVSIASFNVTVEELDSFEEVISPEKHTKALNWLCAI